MEATLQSNWLLRALDGSARERFEPKLHRFELRRGALLHDQGDCAASVIFPEYGLIAVLSETLAGESVQTGMIGCDGAIGAVEALGSGQFLSKGVVQVHGAGWRVNAGAYRNLLYQCDDFKAALDRYVELQLIEARQIMACNALHSVESRLARALLETRERSCLDGVLPLTQDALSQMLGAQRTTIAVFISKLQRLGLLRSGRGMIEILDTASLEAIACTCRKTLQFARNEIGALNGDAVWRPQIVSQANGRRANGGADSPR
ncbi:MAG: Crp/Fnr family transcriptional regulator [Hyphomonadaceae bacterium]